MSLHLPGLEDPVALGRLSRGPGSQGGFQPKGQGTCSALWGPKASVGGGGMEGVQEALGGQGGLARTGSWTQVASVRGTWERGWDPSYLFPRPLVVGPPVLKASALPPSACPPPPDLAPPPGPGSPRSTGASSILGAPCGPSPCRRASSCVSLEPLHPMRPGPISQMGCLRLGGGGTCL